MANGPLGERTSQPDNDFRIPREAVQGVSPRELPFKVIEHIWMAFATPFEPDRRYDELTVGQKSIYALLWARAEIDNGGFAQFFTNSTGFFAGDLPVAARAVGLDPAHVAVFEEANGLFPSGEVPRERAAREAAFDEISERDPDRLDREF